MEIFLEHLGRGFINMLFISMPCVLVAAGIGLVVGILQAVTQVQEQTIAAAPKILCVFLTIMLLGGFFTNILTGYLRESANIAFEIVTKQDDFVLSPLGFAAFKRDVVEPHKMGVSKVDELMKKPGKGGYVDHTKGPSRDRANPVRITPDLMEKNKIIENHR